MRKVSKKYSFVRLQGINIYNIIMTNLKVIKGGKNLLFKVIMLFGEKKNEKKMEKDKRREVIIIDHIISTL